MYVKKIGALNQRFSTFFGLLPKIASGL